MLKNSLLVIGVTGMLVLGSGCRPRSRAPAVASPPRTEASAPVSVSGRISVFPANPGLNESYIVTCDLQNHTPAVYRVLRVETSLGTFLPGSPEFRHAVVEPNQTASVAEVTRRVATPGTVTLTATVVTDRGSIDAPPVQFSVRDPNAPFSPERALVLITAAPNPAYPNQAIIVNYDLIDSTGRDVTVQSIESDTLTPFTPGTPGWLTDRVTPNSRATILRRIITEHDPGSYPIHAAFYTSRGRYDADPVTLIVSAPPPAGDTGHMIPLIGVIPNPVSLHSTYLADYQIVNTTHVEIEVTAINTDNGLLAAGVPGWLTSRVGPYMTEVVARIRGTADSAGVHSKTATFYTDRGILSAQPVPMTVRQ